MTIPEPGIRVKRNQSNTGSVWAKRHAAAQLATHLAAARAHLSTFRPLPCCDCGDLFQPAGRASRRCLDCAFEAREVGI